MENIKTDLPLIQKTEDVFTHEEIIYLGEKLIDFEVVGIIEEGEELTKVYKRSE